MSLGEENRLEAGDGSEPRFFCLGKQRIIATVE